jgi:class 3 adenylate cyclase
LQGRASLDRGGDRHANQALWRIVMVRMANDLRTRLLTTDRSIGWFVAERWSEGTGIPAAVRWHSERALSELSASVVRDGARLTGVRDTEVRWAELDGKSIACEVCGEGPIDLLLVQQWGPIDLLWELPQLASFLDKLGAMARVVVYDTLSTGASDRVTSRDPWNVELFADVALAVLDAVDSPRAVLLDVSGGMSGATFAAMYPQRIQSLILVNLRSSYRELRAMTAAQRERFAKAQNGVRSLEVANPRVAHDPVLRQWWARAKRLRSTREDNLAQVEWAATADNGSVLPSVRVPTLVLHRRDNRMFDIETSRAAANLIPNARFVGVPGSESDVFLGDTAPVFAEIDQFLREPDTESARDRPLATVLFTDMVASTEHLAAHGDAAWKLVLDDHDHAMDRIVAEYRGRVISHIGDGMLATFDGPARGVRCAAALIDAASNQGITLRAGLHTGEIELRPSDIAGIAVHIASRISVLARPSEILVSRTVVDLTTGSGLKFEPRGDHELKGIPGTWSTFAAQSST